MKSRKLILKASEPLVVTSGSSESMAHRTLGHIPGNMLLGAFAEAWKARHPGVCPDDDPGFRALFLDGGVFWGNAVPTDGRAGTQQIPLSYMRIKNRKGLPHAREDCDGHAVVNLLRIAEGETLSDLLRAKGIIAEGEVPKLKKFPGGFFSPSSMRLVTEGRDWNIHVALETKRSAMEGRLFGYSSIAAGTCFGCTILCAAPEAEKQLDELLASTGKIRVGRSRSAGYGLVEIKGREAAAEAAETVRIAAGETCAFYMQSNYIPEASWDNPMDAFVREAAEAAGAGFRVTKKFAAFADIQGWNSLWRKPRDSRAAIVQGSVVAGVFDRDVELPGELILGGDRLEGCGRILVEPAFLAEAFPSIPLKGSVEQEKAPAVPAGTSPVWKLLRRRAIQAFCERRALELLAGAEWGRFLKTVSKNDRPTQSQRGNIRAIATSMPSLMWKDAFVGMLYKDEERKNPKTACAQWRSAFCYSPWTKRNEDLDSVMEDILTPAQFEKQCLMDSDVFPGGPLSPLERREAVERMHRIFVIKLMASWGRFVRTGKGGE